MTLGSSGSSRTARPGCCSVLRAGLLVISVGASVAISWACVDQPLTVVETPPASGGTGTVASGSSLGAQGSTDENSQGGRSSTDAGGGRSNTNEAQGGGNSETYSCPKFGDPCDPKWGCCWGTGLVCDVTRCRIADGYACGSSDECRTGSSCKNAVCVVNEYTYTTCARIGNRCGDPSDCCSGSCFEKKCQETEGCKPVREYCSSSWACCSGNLVTSISSGPSYCDYEHTDTCKLSGETCGKSAWDISKACCDGLECLVSPEGVFRCTSAPSPQARCNIAKDCARIGASEPHCLKHTDPEVGAHSPAGASYGTCQVCATASESCEVDYDCCANEGLECHNDVCIKSDTQSTNACGTLGASCTVSGTTTGGSGSTTTVPCCEGFKCDTHSLECVSST